MDDEMSHSSTTDKSQTNARNNSNPSTRTSDMQVSTPDDAPLIVMTRTFEAPRDLVWEAFTDPRHVSKWYGGHGFQNPVCEMDVRPGGSWRHVMRTPDGMDFHIEYVFVEVVKPSKLVWQNADYGKRATSEPGRHPDNVMTVTLEELGPKLTKWTLVTRFDSIEERNSVLEIGFTEMIKQGSEKLNDLVKGLG